MASLLVKLLVIALATLVTVAIMIWVVHWPHRTVWPGAITSGVLTAVLLIVDRTVKV